MERLISKLNRPPVRFNRDGFLKALNKNSKEAIVAMRDSPELKKAVIVDVLQRFHKILKSAKFPDGVSMVPNGFFLYGGQVIQEVFQQTKKIVDPKIGAAMMMTPSSDYDGQIILKFKEDGKISAKENISKETKLKAFLKKAMIKAAQPYGALFKVSVPVKQHPDAARQAARYLNLTAANHRHGGPAHFACSPRWICGFKVIRGSKDSTGNIFAVQCGIGFQNSGKQLPGCTQNFIGFIIRSIDRPANTTN